MKVREKPGIWLGSFHLLCRIGGIRSFTIDRRVSWCLVCVSLDAGSAQWKNLPPLGARWVCAPAQA